MVLTEVRDLVKGLPRHLRGDGTVYLELLASAYAHGDALQYLRKEALRLDSKLETLPRMAQLAGFYRTRRNIMHALLHDAPERSNRPYVPEEIRVVPRNAEGNATSVTADDLTSGRASMHGQRHAHVSRTGEREASAAADRDREEL